MPTALSIAPALDEDACWARLTGEAAAGPDFLYGVVTTGVVCRPGCASRRPKRENTRFFADLASAEAAGFRPCKRCRPDQAAPAAAARAGQAVETACRLIRETLEAGEAAPTLGALAEAVHLSPFHFQRLFKRLTGMSPRDYAAGCKQGRLVAALAKGDQVASALYEAGYGAVSDAYRAVKQATGTTPAKLRAGGFDLYWGIVPTVFGLTLVAATERGIAALFMGEDEALLAADLAMRFPNARLIRDEGHIEPLLAAVAARAAEPDAGGDLPLDLRGTAFEISVWQALRAIPIGETRTYGALAAAIGKPGAARAVGRACGANPVSILVPCHRAVGADGSLTGYRWGTARKRRLLEMEREAAS
ncbi:bifunctional DNA-binding transcriptional regulator/O6-methylguanine-DNA methyltransferase Ada [Zavarzinia compransoris]|uniref:bifunctional DNA-binding transcriptional regulator/O6-methylguanine-DNA methyltransferase Ada n=1 Tax=Zavarzinia marina TaxID=2911065 RepID=UPI001F27F28D|nr:bifunctional DNA-binding transcriptional regulator/O6-methylguanine-DNA methyltransferase Ada [Zavarzinia marina]MCF4166056.1 bifunctional DNA-binding transcriptional regulator/O6-methylguanine-DNA methyltransferase Ada [Zavarzinia marina]